MERISPHQFMTIGVAVLLGTTFLPIAGIVTGVSGRDGWMAVLPGFAVGIPYGFMVLSLLAQHPRQNLLQITEALFGKGLGKLIGVIYIVIVAYLGGLLLGEIGVIYQGSIMPLTPIEVFYLGGLFLVGYLVRSGIEVFTRFSEVIVPLVVVGLILNVGLSLPRMEQGELLPLLGEGVKPLLYGVLEVMPFPMTYILFLAGMLSFLPTSKRELGEMKAGLWRIIFLAGSLDTLITLIQILVFGPTETIRLVYGLLVLGKMVEISQTVAGVESLFMGVWLGAAVLKITACFYATLWGLETVFQGKGVKWNLAVGAVFMGIAFGFTNAFALIREIGIVDNYLTMPFVALWVPTLWGVSRWKKRTSVS